MSDEDLQVYFDKDGNMKTVNKQKRVGAYYSHKEGYYIKEGKIVDVDKTTAGTNSKEKIDEYKNDQKKITDSMDDSGYTDILSSARKADRINELAQTDDFKNPKHNTYLTDEEHLEECQQLIEAEKEEYKKQLIDDLDKREKEYLVRGALMRCNCGSHVRRLNLPKSHGVYENERPQMNASDSLPGDSLNIPTFGVCSSGENNSGGEVLLVADVQRDMYGKKIGESEGNVKGTPCSPIIVSKWLNSYKNKIVDGDYAVNGESFLVCKYQGLIEILDSGQNDEETLVD